MLAEAPDMVKEPVIVSPALATLLLSPVSPVKPAPLPTKVPEKNGAVTPPFWTLIPDVVRML